MKRLLLAGSLSVASAFLMAMACAAQTDQTGGNQPVAISDEEAENHRIGDSSLIRAKLDPHERELLQTPGIRVRGLWGNPGIAFKVTVDASGIVTDITAAGENVLPNLQAQAEAVAKSTKYQPFERNGHAVWARFNEAVLVLPPEIKPSQQVPFPDIDDWKSVRITLQRTGCFGACPVYGVEIHGDGTVIYQGKMFVAAVGERRASISREAVHQLVDAFRQADFYSLQNEYILLTTDLPTFETSIEIGGQMKKVTDYAGEQVGMPRAVSKLEETIDRVANTERWVKGTAEPVIPASSSAAHSPSPGSPAPSKLS